MSHTEIAILYVIIIALVALSSWFLGETLKKKRFILSFLFLISLFMAFKFVSWIEI